MRPLCRRIDRSALRSAVASCTPEFACYTALILGLLLALFGERLLLSTPMCRAEALLDDLVVESREGAGQLEEKPVSAVG
jgi:hypothetical protein